MRSQKIKLLIPFLFFIVQGFSQLDFSSDKKYTMADTLRGTLSPLRSCYNVLFYDLDVKVDIDNKFISGSNTIKFLSEHDFKKLQVDLFSNMKIEKIDYNGHELNYTRAFNAVFITFPDTIRKGVTQSFVIYYSGNPIPAKHAPWDGGFSWDKDKEGNPFVGVSCQGTGASLWWPCKDHQSDEPAEMSIRVAVPHELDEISNGRLIRKTVLQDGWTKYEWHVSYPINNYDVTLNIGKYRHFSDFYYNKNYKDTLTLDYYVLADNYDKAQKQFVQVKPMMSCYYNYFGEYPFIKDGYKLVEAPYLGMEHQSCVAYGNGYKDGYNGFDISGTGYKFDYIIIHESAHEWWGNSITTNDLADMWIHEGFATYSEALYIECLYGHAAYLKYINSEKKSVQNDSPIIGKYNLNDEGSEDMYYKGALLIHTIRSIIDDDKKFFEIIKGIQDKFKYQTVDSKDIEQYISDNSGIDFSDIFDRYLHYAAIPKLLIAYKEEGNDLKIYFKYELPENSGFVMPVKITIAKDKYDFVLPSDNYQTLLLKDMNIGDFKVATDLFYINVSVDEYKDPPIIQNGKSDPSNMRHFFQTTKTTK
ncbi:MAG: M1 family metallopeptidase [Bacteroidia bacterium]